MLAIATVLFAYPIFLIYNNLHHYYWIAFGLSALLNGFAWGIIPSLLAMLFPTTIRYSGIALSYNIGFAIFGGLTPLIAVSLIYETGSLVAPAVYLIIVSLLAAIALLLARVNVTHSSYLASRSAA
jgi:hypothetical protein